MRGENNVCFGRKMSEEQRARLKSLRGENHHAYGKPAKRIYGPVSEETRLKKSISMKLAIERKRLADKS